MKRKDINKLSNQQVDNYIHALNILRERSDANPEDSRGYDFQARLHNDVDIGPCEHRNDLFLPWHRAHLHYFERLLQGADPPRTSDVTIPYWDWTHPEQAGKFPAAFERPGLTSPPDEPDRNQRPAALPDDTLEIVTTETDIGEFGGFPEENPGADTGRLEAGPHNYMHSFFIGGAMGSPETAAKDPIYFSFHCFIDLMWAEWQRRNNAPAPTSPDHDLRGFLDQPKHKVADFRNTTDLDYTYEYSDRLNAAFSVPPSPAPSRKLLTALPLEALSNDDLVRQLSENSFAQLGFTLPRDRGAQVVIRLEKLQVPVTGNYMLRCFVHPADVEFRAGDADFTQDYNIGYVAMWRTHPAGHHHHAGRTDHPAQPHNLSFCTVGFDATTTLNLRPASEPYVLTLQYIPAPSPTGEPQRPPELVQEVAMQRGLLEVYG